ncbi:hypothetical protein QJS10_CPB15g01260 [Acorus calamus]|uniref:F-box domain-containing protein n=1 Tax=Acorus calamus TaxID=4465 RepID=A0AAV9D868_ACOCL|nr:hypothetical protein QJS10_CPB15g01260 [Acorus calamus]
MNEWLLVRFQQEWSELPYDLLELILERLSLQESILFGGVCKSWHETFTHYKPPSDQHPLFSTLSYGLISHFFNVRTYDEESSPSPSFSSPLPDITEKHDELCDASHGWLLMKPHRNSTIYLFNPFVKDEGSLIVIPNCPIKHKYAFLLQPPNEFLVMVDSGDREIYYVRGSSSSSGWCELLRPSYIATHFERVVPASSAIGKDDIYYGIDEYGRLFTIDLHLRSITCLEEVPVLNSFCMNLVRYAGEVFAVLKYGNIRRNNNGGGDDDDDDEVGVIEGFNYRLSDHQCIKFKVFRLDLKSLAWVRVDDLGEHVIYVSDLCCAMVRACRGEEGGNRIYFIDRYVKCNAEWYVFNMKDWSTERGPPKLNSNKDNDDDRMKNWFWFTPNHEISRSTVQEEVESSSVLPPAAAAAAAECDNSEANKGDGDQLMMKPIIDSKKGKLHGKSRNDKLNLQQQQQQPNSKRGRKSRKGQVQVDL